MTAYLCPTCGCSSSTIWDCLETHVVRIEKNL